MINGRTESQVKNRFKLILRREQIQHTKVDQKDLRNRIIPQIVQRLKKAIADGAPVSDGAQGKAESPQLGGGTPSNREDSEMASPGKHDEDN